MVELGKVLDSVNAAAEACGRKGEVVLMAVSKTHPYEDVLEACSQGQRLFGENRVQEVLEKFPPKAERPEGMYLALIGHLQRNKVRKIVPYVDRIDSVDSLALLSEIEKECVRSGITLPVLFEFNSSGEEQKSGFRGEDELLSAVAALADYPHVVLEGVMTVGPLGGDEALNRAAFTRTKKLFDKVAALVPTCRILSMGMSGDFPLAIECGSSEVRIGTAIFGARDYNV